MRADLLPRHLDVQFHDGEAPTDALERLGALPGVVDAGHVATIPALPKGSSREEFQAFGHGGLDEGLGRDFDRSRLEVGRRPSAADEVMVSSALARELEVGVGDSIVLDTFTPEDIETLFSGGATDRNGPEVPLRVVGVGRQPEELTAGEDSAFPLDLVAPAFLEVWAGTVHYWDGNFVVKLAEGTDGISAFEEAARAEFSDREDLFLHVSEENARIETAISTEVTAVALLAIVAALAGAVVLGQAATRFARSAAGDQEILGVLGLDRRAVAWGRVALVAVPIVAGVGVALAVAIGLSGVFPTGIAGRLEPDPGLRVEGAVLVVGAWALVMIALIATALFGRVRRGPGAARSSAVTRVLSLAPPLVAATVGARAALQPDRGSRAVPVRSAMVACGAGVAGLVAALLFATSLGRLVADPNRYGSNWDLEAALGDELTDEQAPEQAQPVVTDRRIEAARYARLATRTFGDEEVLTMGTKPVRADLTTPIVEGRDVEADDEVVFGRTTLDQVGRSVGDRVIAASPEGPVELRVVGQDLFPTTEGDNPASGAVVTLATLNRLSGDGPVRARGAGRRHSALRTEAGQRRAARRAGPAAARLATPSCLEAASLAQKRAGVNAKREDHGMAGGDDDLLAEARAAVHCSGTGRPVTSDAGSVIRRSRSRRSAGSGWRRRSRATWKSGSGCSTKPLRPWCPARSPLFERGYAALKASVEVRLAELRVVQGRMEDAQHLLDAVGEHPDVARPLAMLHLAQGRTEMAREVLRRRLDDPDLDHDVAAPLWGVLVDVQLAQNDLEGAARSVAHLESIAAERPSLPFVAATAALAQGRLCVARNEPAAALDAFRRLGAEHEAAAAAAFLGQLGVRTRAGAKGGKLSERERQVLALLAEGLSNGEIADRLYLQP